MSLEAGAETTRNHHAIDTSGAACNNRHIETRIGIRLIPDGQYRSALEETFEVCQRHDF
jgi:hypothetical protein